MCLECHLVSNDKDVYNTLSNYNIKDFSIYNITSLSHIIIGASGFNGKKSRNAAIKHLEDYKLWTNKTKNYSIIKSDDLENIIKYIKNNKCNKDINKLKIYLMGINFY